jgi:hypothetical protein
MLSYPSKEALIACAGATKLTNEATASLSQFVLNEEQLILASHLEQDCDVMVLKSRQIGVSTITALFDLLVAVMNERINVCVCLDTNSKASAFITRISQFCADLSIKPSKSNSKTIEFSNGSKIFALGASGGGKNGKSSVGRSMSFNLLHCTELAFWENEGAFSALKSCAPNGRTIIESTAHGPTGVFAKLWHDDNAYKKIFFSVEQHSSYRADGNLISNDRWKELQALGFSNREAASWWNNKWLESGLRESDFLRDFCVREEQPFLLSVGKVFDEAPVVEPLSKSEGQPCVISVDIAKGKGGDDTVIMVTNRQTSAIIDVWASNQEDIHAVTARLKEFEARYKPAHIMAEANGVGKGFITAFQLKGLNVIEVHTTDSTKEMGFSNLRKALRAKVPMPLELAQQITNLRFENNRYYGRDDYIMAYCFALNFIAENPYSKAKQTTLIDKLLKNEGYF